MDTLSACFSSITFFATWLILKRWAAKEWIPAVPEVTAEIQETNSDNVDDLLIKDKDLPGTFASFLTILIPVILIAGGSFVGMLIPESTPDDALVRTLVAIASVLFFDMAMCVIYTMFLALGTRPPSARAIWTPPARIPSASVRSC